MTFAEYLKIIWMSGWGMLILLIVIGLVALGIDERGTSK